MQTQDDSLRLSPEIQAAVDDGGWPRVLSQTELGLTIRFNMEHEVFLYWVEVEGLYADFAKAFKKEVARFEEQVRKMKETPEWKKWNMEDEDETA